MARVSFWWIVGVHGLVAAAGVVLVLSGLVFGSGDGGLDITAVLSGGILLFAIAGLVACLPGLLLLRREAKGLTRPGAPATLAALALPIVVVAVPVFGDYRVFVAVGAFASALPILLTLVSMIRRRAGAG
ncbi:MAG: hypothetical protein EBU70_06175 [Actinobacteria bacterium]|nr:hypothetical protein [Actinomycetota bacterium]